MSDLNSEIDYLTNVLAVHASDIDRARRTAEQLAEQAAETTADGIKDLVDEDAEVDAAIKAAEVRQASIRAIYAAKRLRQLESLGSTLAFGKITDANGEELYVGRHSVIDGDDALLVDWRAAAAVPFYRATYSEPLGVVHRRNFLYGDESESNSVPLVDYSDELFGSPTFDGGSTVLRGEAAVLASLESSTTDHLTSVVSTIQHEQDRVVRAPADVPLVVQGGPGTGKTVVALHRAAYLLYHYRVDLEDVGILVVGPSKQFLSYISRVIPSLGESGVVSVTPPQLYPGIKVGQVDTAEVEVIKGSIEMVELLRTYIELRQVKPTEDLETWYGSTKVTLKAEVAQEVFAAAKTHPIHNDASAVFKSRIVEQLTQQLFSASFDNAEELRAFFRADTAVHKYCLRAWPNLSPEQALNDLLGSKPLLRKAAEGLGIEPEKLDLLFRKRCLERDLENATWSSADVALLDEISFLVDGLVGDIDSQRQTERDRLDAMEVALERDERLERDEGLDLDECEEIPDGVDPLDPTGFWKTADPDLELYPIMYDEAEGTSTDRGGRSG